MPDPSYEAFIAAVKQYLLSYNIFCLTTTIEGALINSNTVSFALEFLKSHTKQRDFEKFITYWETLQKNDQTNLLRILFNGKSDLLKARKDAYSFLDPDTKPILDRITIGGKASGWVSEYLDNFFHSAVTIDGTFTEKSFRRYLADDDNREKLLNLFQQNFLELYSLIEKLCAMIGE